MLLRLQASSPLLLRRNEMLKLYIKLLRPSQWFKNLMLVFPPFLGGVLFQPDVLRKGLIPFTAFCLASSSTYILNDIIDREKDSHHPKKKFRPISSGKVKVPSASFLAALLFVVSIVLSLRISTTFIPLLLAFCFINVVYSVALRDFPILDIFCISTGFLLRLQAGGEAFGVVISEWLFMSVFLLALFLSTGKRLSEKNNLGLSADMHRKSLKGYPDGFLDGIMFMTGGAVLVTYAMYVISRPALIYTVPLCVYGLMRYMFIVKSGEQGDPTEALLKDAPLFFVGIFWTAMIGWSIYK